METLVIYFDIPQVASFAPSKNPYGEGFHKDSLASTALATVVWIRAMVVRSSWAVVRAMVRATLAHPHVLWTPRCARNCGPMVVWAAQWWCGPRNCGAVLLGRSPRNRPRTPKRSGRLATLVIAAREDRTT